MPLCYRCTLCGRLTELIEVCTGWVKDEAYGRPVWVPEYDSVTECCGTEDYEDIEEDDQ